MSFVASFVGNKHLLERGFDKARDKARDKVKIQYGDAVLKLDFVDKS